MTTYNEFLADFAIGYERHLETSAPNTTKRLGRYFTDLLESVRPDVAEALKELDSDFPERDAVTTDDHARIESLWGTDNNG
jgi:hypothetical protein